MHLGDSQRSSEIRYLTEEFLIEVLADADSACFKTFKPYVASCQITNQKKENEKRKQSPLKLSYSDKKICEITSVI